MTINEKIRVLYWHLCFTKKKEKGFAEKSNVLSRKNCSNGSLRKQNWLLHMASCAKDLLETIIILKCTSVIAIYKII